MTTPPRTAAPAGRVRRGRLLRASAGAVVVGLALTACSNPRAQDQLENREDSRVDADSTPSATIKPVLPSADTDASGDPSADPVEPLPGPSDQLTPLPQASTTP